MNYKERVEYHSNHMERNDTVTLIVPKVIARIKICGGGLAFSIYDNM